MSNRKYCYQAFVILEAASPLRVGTGHREGIQDNPILRDAFQIPYIPATSLAGVLRHLHQEVEGKTTSTIFGSAANALESDKTGSRIEFSSMHLVLGQEASQWRVADGVKAIHELKAPLDQHYRTQFREHVRINHRGVADKENHGKFDSELLPKGSRFACQISFWPEQEDPAAWEEVLQLLQHPLFRLGAGSRKGFGQMKLVALYERQLDFSQEEDMDRYLQTSACLDKHPTALYNKRSLATLDYNELKHYQLQLEAEDFVLFGGDFNMEIFSDLLKKSDKELQKGALPDFSPKLENIIAWDGPRIQEKEVYLFPATSIKGAIAHRFVYHLRRLKEDYIDHQAESFEEEENQLSAIQNHLERLTDSAYAAGLEEIKADLEKLKEVERELVFLAEGLQSSVGGAYLEQAVKSLFGLAAKEGESGQEGQRGRLLLSDVFLTKDKVSKKIFNHVAIDRFTAGALDQALYSEEVLALKEGIRLDLYVEKAAFERDPLIQQAFEAALKDLVSGHLPLGGGVMRGHGRMKGEIQTTQA
ncbi:putative RAMP superfamily protein probably involved in DNA repair [Saprospira grandis DSM 2844]|uniref:Putative RAMP superfamily protein probably involved in DNA repair n=1 Tax=Saprospira grandis DSM 2844 TaxID=694433 RepID=J0XZ66_9BACT|nr:RAMP superfamily CRISPR-associated protein [Saprospira grandis]EJF54476.1 putative RAMP superfamily protein probably involved in DNA repair [Saprospira grandis DSM 2844]